jgi:hypothetical protein
MRTRIPGGSADQRDAGQERELIRTRAAKWVRKRKWIGYTLEEIGDEVFAKYEVDVTDMTISRWRRGVHRDV